MGDPKLVRRDDFTSLRDRIAALLYTRHAHALGYVDEWDGVDHEPWLEDADAVIAELGLFREFTWEGSTKLSRVVSKWVAE
jgi:hypothetical protein